MLATVQYSSSDLLIGSIATRTAQIAVLGLGYVGTPLAVHLAQAGFNVLGYDVSQARVADINSGRSPVQDVEDHVIGDLVGRERLRATWAPQELRHCNVFILCVPTPLDDTKQPDVSYIVDAARTIAPHLGAGALVILESTTYPGTTEELLLPLLEEGGLRGEDDLFVAFSPERVDPGNATFSTGNIPKLVGGIGPVSTQAASELYRSFLCQVHPVSSPRVAEMAKLHENTFRAVNIGYVNELAVICHTLGIDVWEVVDAAATKPFGFMPFYPGPGIGGHCIPLDPHYLAWRARKEGYVTRFINLADHVNSDMPRHVATRTMELLNDAGRPMKGSHVLVFGVTYKADVADARESPALDVIRELEARGAQVRFVDPYVQALPAGHGPALRAAHADLNGETLAWADLGLILTNHGAFDWAEIARQVPLLFDTRGAARGVAGNVVQL